LQRSNELIAAEYLNSIDLRGRRHQQEAADSQKNDHRLQEGIQVTEIEFRWYHYPAFGWA
jgi:hypothetical protein